MTNWKEVRLTPTAKNFIELMTEGNPQSALNHIDFLSRVKSTTGHIVTGDGRDIQRSEVDFSGLTSVFVLLKNDRELETGYFDPQEPLKYEHL